MTDENVDSLILGTSSRMQELRREVRRAARSRSPVLIQGPTGAGKELVARGLHVESGRPGRFVARNVAAIPEALFESEIMGHVRGAFTNAIREHAGALRRAHLGTAFLDEIGDMNTSAQKKLLRVIETGEVLPVGADVAERSDFRLVTATNVNLREAEQRGLFRSDLLYRLRGIVISVPPLRDHPEDITQLAMHFAHEVASESMTSELVLTPKAIERLERYDWPGNVRQLRQVVISAAVLSDSGKLTETHVERALGGFCGNVADVGDAQYADHRRTLLALIDQYQGDVRAVARVLGITRSATYRRMHRLGIAVPRRGRRFRLISVGNTGKGASLADLEA